MLAAADLGNQRDAIVQIRAGIELWLKLHPNTTIKMPDAPPQPWTVEQMGSQVSLLRETVAAILKEDPGRPFDLGVTTVSVTAEASPLSPVADSFDRIEIVNRQAADCGRGYRLSAGSGHRSHFFGAQRSRDSGSRIHLARPGALISGRHSGSACPMTARSTSTVFLPATSPKYRLPRDFPLRCSVRMPWADPSTWSPSSRKRSLKRMR